MYRLLFFFLLFSFTEIKNNNNSSWIRINQLGYTPEGIKIAIWCSKEKPAAGHKSFLEWQLVEVNTDKIVFTGKATNPFGAYGPFEKTFRLNFTQFKKLGKYFLQSGETRSPVFQIGDDVYKGAADFCLRYMRQQRSGFNPFLKDSCHTRDGYVLYGAAAGIKDSTHVDVTGGWHDATDYLQYSTTSANAAYHLLMAYRDFPAVFRDEKQANGLDGSNGIADVLDEAKWGLDWLLKMHPRKDWLFNQLADDRDHIGMRLPKLDSQYGKGYERPVYFINSEPQQRGKFLNNTTGTSSTAAKFSSAFSLGSLIFKKLNKSYAETLLEHAHSSFLFGLKKPGVTQTASVLSPYIYAEDNWTDDMELAAAGLHLVSRKKNYITQSLEYAKAEKITPWLGTDTARHYQWYPFINIGHYELAKQLSGKTKDTIISYYKEGIKRVWNKAQTNAFYRGIPYIWCSNNLTASFAVQCYWYRQLSGDKIFLELEQANFDWLFGCNPWGTSMVYGLPADGDTPVDPHSSFTHLNKYPIDGGLVDGPVYGSIYKNLIGLTLYEADEYAEFQSDLAVYHDDFGDYSTNEPTMDGTASLIYLLAAKEEGLQKNIKTNKEIRSYGGIIRGDTTLKKIALVFTGDEFADGGDFIAKALQQQNIKGSFFLTGNFYRKPEFRKIIKRLKENGNYLSSHSDKHLLYCDWEKRDSLLVTQQQFSEDLQNSYNALKQWNINKDNAYYFLPPYEWYNDSIAKWTQQMGLQLVNFSPGTRSSADYTYPEMGSKYLSSNTILNSILEYERNSSNGLNGFVLLSHIGTDPRRKDKFYYHLPSLIRQLKNRGYQFVKINELID